MFEVTVQITVPRNTGHYRFKMQLKDENQFFGCKVACDFIVRDGS